MKFYSVYDAEFKPYGKVLEGYDTKELVDAMLKIDLPETGVADRSTMAALFNENAKKALKPYVLKVSVADQRVYAYAPDANGEFGAMMLKANFMLRATDGATLCQNPETGAYALVRQLPLALADAESLGAGIESLVNQAEEWRRTLAGIRYAEEARAEETEGASDHNGLLSSGFFHV